MLGIPLHRSHVQLLDEAGHAKNLVVFFEGGGACWDGLTCAAPITSLPPNGYFVPAIGPFNDPANFDGIFNLSSSANPVKDWSFVYIPYCTGDLHLGSATTHYVSVSTGSPLLPPPLLPPGTEFDIQHRGFDNFMVVLDWITKNFSAPKNDPRRGLVGWRLRRLGELPVDTGSLPERAHVRDRRLKPGRHHGHVGCEHSRTGFMESAVAAVGVRQRSFAVAAEDLLRISAEAYPQAKVAQFTTTFDETQVLFYGLNKQFYPPGGACPIVPVDWNQQMLTTLKSYATDLGNFRYYVAGGSDHMIMEFPRFYTESSPGISFSKWVGAMLQSSGGTNGSGGGNWKDAACPTCLVSPACASSSARDGIKTGEALATGRPTRRGSASRAPSAGPACRRTPSRTPACSPRRR